MPFNPIRTPPSTISSVGSSIGSWAATMKRWTIFYWPCTSAATSTPLLSIRMPADSWSSRTMTLLSNASGNDNEYVMIVYETLQVYQFLPHLLLLSVINNSELYVCSLPLACFNLSFCALTHVSMCRDSLLSFPP